MTLLVWGFFLSNAWKGIDFGYHWDEQATTISIKETVETGVLLPLIYLYPGMCYDLALLALLPEAYRELTTGETPWRHMPAADSLLSSEPSPTRSRFDIIQESLQSYVEQPAYLLTVRRLFAFVSSLLILWVFAALWTTSGTAWLGLLGAGLAGFSWEFLYHSRWAVPDAMTASFAALVLFVCALILKYPHRTYWFTVAAISAGLCASGKYPGAITMLSVSLAIMAATGKTGTSWWKPMISAWLWFVAAFLVTSPGTVLNPLRFFDGLQYNKQIYSLGHPGHTIDAGWTHIQAILGYLATSVSSSQLWLSLLVTLVVVIGIISLIRQKLRGAWLLVPFALYVLYMGSQNVFFVRNSQLLIPYWIAFAGAGVWSIWKVEKLKNVLRAALIGLALVLVAVNADAILSSSESIVTRVQDRPQRLPDFLDWLSEQSEPISLSPQITAELNHRNLPLPPNSVGTFAEAQLIAFYLSEENSYWPKWEAHHRHLFRAEFGPREVNLNYYPFWGGEDRIVVIPRATAQSFGIRQFSNRVGPWPLFER